MADFLVLEIELRLWGRVADFLKKQGRRNCAYLKIATVSISSMSIRPYAHRVVVTILAFAKNRFNVPPPSLPPLHQTLLSGSVFIIAVLYSQLRLDTVISFLSIQPLRVYGKNVQ